MSKQDTCLSVVEALDALMRTTSIDRVKVTELCHDAGLRIPYEPGTVRDIGAGISEWLSTAAEKF